MSNITAKDRNRVVFTSSGGDNDDTGFTDALAKRDLSDAIATVNALTPTPSLADPASIVELGSTTYFGDFVSPDYVTGLLSGSRIQGTLTLPASAFVQYATISTQGQGSNTTAVRSNGKSRTSLDAKAIILYNSGDIGFSVEGSSSEVFCNVGQILAQADNQVLVKFNSSGIPRRLNYNELNIGIDGFVSPENCVAFEYYSDSTSHFSFICSSISNDGGGANNVGIHIQKGYVAAFITELDFAGVDAIFVGNGLDIAELDIFNAHVAGNITTNNLGVLNASLLQLEGNITCNPNSTMNISVLNHVGSIFNAGSLNGTINGVKYGSFKDGDDILATFQKEGNVGAQFETIGYLTIDTTTDTINSIAVTYFQSNNQSRTHDMQIVDVDSPSTVYFADNNTSSGQGFKSYDGFTAVTPLPSNQEVNLAIQQDRTGSGLSDGGVNIEFTRV